MRRLLPALFLLLCLAAGVRLAPNRAPIRAACTLPTPPPASTACDVIRPERVRGLVTGAAVGATPEAPIAGAIVELLPEPWWPCPTAVTGADGYFTIDCPLRMPCGCNTLHVRAEGYAAFQEGFSSQTLVAGAVSVGLRRAERALLPLALR